MSLVNINTYLKNFIFCGEIDFYCLLCTESFNSLQKVNNHVKLRHHRKSVNKQGYNNDLIYQIRDNLFYCIPCNEVTTEPKKHKTSDSHTVARYNSRLPKCDQNQYSITRLSNETVVIANTLLITDLQWNGIDGNFCDICLKEIKTGPWKHIILEEHIIKLIQTHIIKYKHNFYRMMDHDKFFCFFCFETYDIHSVENHSLSVCKGGKLKDNPRKPYSYLRKIIKSDAKLKKLFIIEDETKNKVQCVICKCLVDGSILYMTEHRKCHPGVLHDVMDHGKRRRDLAIYGKRNHIKLNRVGNWCFCSLCHRVFSASLHQAIDHVSGETHKFFLELEGFTRPTEPKKSQKLRKERFEVYLNQTYKLYDDFYIHKYRRQFSFISFMLLSPYGFDDIKYFCFACNKIILKNDMREHCKTGIHIKNILECYVINETSLRLEFVRMIRPNLYHCGICNLIFPYWKTIDHHLKGIKHLIRKKITMKEQQKTPKVFNEHGFTFQVDAKNHLIRLGFVSPDQYPATTSTA